VRAAQLRVARRCCLFEILLGVGGHLVAVDLGDGRFELLDDRRPGQGADAGAGASLVEHVDRLVRQKPGG